MCITWHIAIRGFQLSEDNEWRFKDLKENKKKCDKCGDKHRLIWYIKNKGVFIELCRVCFSDTAEGV
jgi:ribosomal protein S14